MNEFIRITKKTFASPKGKMGIILLVVGLGGLSIVNALTAKYNVPIFLTFLFGVTSLIGVSTWTEAMTEIRTIEEREKMEESYKNEE